MMSELHLTVGTRDVQHKAVLSKCEPWSPKWIGSIYLVVPEFLDKVRELSHQTMKN